MAPAQDTGKGSPARREGLGAAAFPPRPGVPAHPGVRGSLREQRGADEAVLSSHSGVL